MRNALTRIAPWSKPAFVLAGAIYFPFAIILGALAPRASEQFGLLIASLDSTVRAIAFLGLLALYGRLFEGSKWLARIGAPLAALGIIGSTIFAVGTLGEYFGLMDTPVWVTAIIPLMLSGFIAAILAGIAVFRERNFTNLVGGLLLLPFIIFVLQFIIGANLPTWSILLFVGGQAATMLAIGLSLPSPRSQRFEASIEEAMS